MELEKKKNKKRKLTIQISYECFILLYLFYLIFICIGLFYLNVSFNGLLNQLMYKLNKKIQIMNKIKIIKK